MSIVFQRLPGVKEKTGYSKSAIYAKETEGDFVPHCRDTQRTNFWIDAELDEWMHRRLSGGPIEPVELSPGPPPGTPLLTAWEVCEHLTPLERKQFIDWHSPGNKPPFPVYFAKDGRRRYPTPPFFAWLDSEDRAA